MRITFATKKKQKSVKKSILISIGKMFEASGKLKIQRGLSLPILTTDDAVYDQLLNAAVEKHKAFDHNFIDDDYYLLYQDGCMAQFLPGTCDSFNLKAYKNACGKPYRRITLYLCLQRHYQATVENVAAIISDDNDPEIIIVTEKKPTKTEEALEDSVEKVTENKPGDPCGSQIIEREPVYIKVEAPKRDLVYIKVWLPKLEPVVMKEEPPKLYPVHIKVGLAKLESVASKEEAPELDPVCMKEEAPELEPVHMKEEAPELEPLHVKEEAPELDPVCMKEEAPELEPVHVKEEALEVESAHMNELAEYNLVNTKLNYCKTLQGSHNASKQSNVTGHPKKHHLIPTGEEPYFCAKSEISSDSETLKRQRIFITGKTYNCTKCGKCFSVLRDLKRHEQIHTGERHKRWRFSEEEELVVMEQVAENWHRLFGQESKALRRGGKVQIWNEAAKKVSAVSRYKRTGESSAVQLPEKIDGASADDTERADHQGSGSRHSPQQSALPSQQSPNSAQTDTGCGRRQVHPVTPTLESLMGSVLERQGDIFRFSQAIEQHTESMNQALQSIATSMASMASSFARAVDNLQQHLPCNSDTVISILQGLTPPSSASGIGGVSSLDPLVHQEELPHTLRGPRRSHIP